MTSTTKVLRDKYGDLVQENDMVLVMSNEDFKNPVYKKYKVILYNGGVLQDMDEDSLPVIDLDKVPSEKLIRIDD